MNDESLDGKCLEDRYGELRDDFLTALNYYKLVSGHNDLRDRFYRVRDEYYENILGVRTVRPKVDEPMDW